jgi:hypothetical protein
MAPPSVQHLCSTSFTIGMPEELTRLIAVDPEPFRALALPRSSACPFTHSTVLTHSMVLEQRLLGVQASGKGEELGLAQPAAAIGAGASAPGHAPDVDWDGDDADSDGEDAAGPDADVPAHFTAAMAEQCVPALPRTGSLGETGLTLLHGIARPHRWVLERRR